MHAKDMTIPRWLTYLIFLFNILPTCIISDIQQMKEFFTEDNLDALTHLYLDFDRVITVNDFSVNVRNQYCGGELYPRCTPTVPQEDTAMITALQSLPGDSRGLLIRTMGGAERLGRVRNWLRRMRRLLHGNIYIVSVSWFPVTALQWKLYLLKVSELLDLGFDESHILSLADPGAGIPSKKYKVVEEVIASSGATEHSSLYVDESETNIESMKSICGTFHLLSAQGLEKTDMEYIERLAAA